MVPVPGYPTVTGSRVGTTRYRPRSNGLNEANTRSTRGCARCTCRIGMDAGIFLRRAEVGAQRYEREHGKRRRAAVRVLDFSPGRDKINVSFPQYTGL